MFIFLIYFYLSTPENGTDFKNGLRRPIFEEPHPPC